MLPVVTQLAVGVLATAFLVPDARAEWDPFRKSFQDRGGSRQGQTAQRTKTPPSTLDYVLVSRQTYDALGLAISRYQQIVRAGGWAVIPSGPTLKYGSRDRRVTFLRHRLQVTGELAQGNPSSDFDGNVHEAVALFQQRHGLTPSGEVNRFTLRALNVSANQRLHQLRLNRNRIRELLSQTDGKKYVLVNIPGYELQAVSGGRLEIASRVVVGKPATPSPEVSASVRAVNFLPYWHVPQSIASRALIPAVKKNPHYLAKEHIRVYASWGGAEVNSAQVNWWAPQGVRYVFRQDPGPFNALGLIRLDMPNRHIVYMHDTPLKKLFGYHLRPYSAGCIRVEQIQPLAAWLLGWNPARVFQATQSGQQQTVELARPVPVHFAYISAWASGNGFAHFRIDIYDKDKADGRDARTAHWDTGSSSIAP